MPRVRFTDPTMKFFSGYYGRHAFVDGVSKESLNDFDVRRMAAITQIKVIDEETGEEKFAGVAHEMVVSRRAGAPISKNPTTLETEPAKEEENQPDVKVFETKPEKTDEERESQEAADELDAEIEKASEEKSIEDAAKVYSREELEQVADDGGIKGLREIASPMGVKDTSIEGLITEILAAQGNK